VEISVYELTSDGLEPFAPDEVVEAWRSGEDAFWVDVVGEDDEWRKRVLAEIGASAFVQRAVHDRPDIASVVDTGHAVYFQIPAIVDDSDEPVVVLDGLIVQGALVTWRDHPIEGIDKLVEGLGSPTDLPWVGTTSDLVASLCVKLSTDAYRASQVLRRQMDAMSDEERSDEGIDDEELKGSREVLARDR
jgi:hypothetical protein